VFSILLMHGAYMKILLFVWIVFVSYMFCLLYFVIVFVYGAVSVTEHMTVKE
jgi:hypothetical protein